MMKFRIDSQVFERLPGVCFGAVVAKGVDNSRPSPKIQERLEAETIAIRRRLDGANLKEHPGILPYREAFRTLGINPNKFMSSVEALSRRVLRGADLPRINPIVDLGNVLSLRYMLPMGAHDIDKLEDSLTVRFAGPDDHFCPFGLSELEAPEAGELVYASGHTVKTRRWIWRQSEDGKIDSQTGNVVFPIDGFAHSNIDAVRAAQEELSELLKALFDCEITIGMLTKDNPAIPL